MSFDEPKVILCADSDPRVLGRLCRLLGGAGYGTLACGSGFDALRMALQYHPDILILDAALNDLDGWSALHAIYRMLPASRPPALILGRDAGDLLRAELAGAAGCVVKPFTETTLAAAVSRAFNAHALRALRPPDCC